MFIMNNLDYISEYYKKSPLVELDEKLTTMKRKVTHGKLKIQRKKVKAQVMKEHNPTDYDREKICRKARKKAHSAVANSSRNISNEIREGLTVVNPKALSISERYGLDFMEEAVGWDADFKFFDKPEVTPITEGLDVGFTKSGKPRKCKAIGIAEGCFAPIINSEGDKVFSRNHRLYEQDHWDCQFENQNLLDRVNTRRMLGTIGHYDKKVDDKDLAKGDVSHIVTGLEIREDEKHGRYLWGRLEIINTEAGRRLKEYYENDIPLYVSSRGGGKLINIPGKDYQVVDKHKYYCETFDVVKEPGFLEACPEYHSESNKSLDQLECLIREIADKEGLVVKESELAALKETLFESKDAELNEDNNMAKVNVDITAEDTMEQIVKKVIQPMHEETQSVVAALAESLTKLTDTVSKIQSDIYEEDEVQAETTQEVSSEESTDVESTEPVKESEKVEESAESTEEVAEGKDEKKDAPEKEEAPKEKACKEEKGKCVKVKEEEEEIPVEESTEEPKAPEEAPAVEPAEKEAEAGAADPAEEKVDEQWAHLDPKETVGKKAEHKAPQGKPETPLTGSVSANDPAPKVSALKKGEDAQKEHDPTNHETKKAVSGAILEGEEASEEATPAADEQQVVDYQAAYESMREEVEKATTLVNETTQMFEDFGKRHREVIAESYDEIQKLKACVETLELELNSYKISEKFDVTIEVAKEMLSSKSYEAVEEELKEGEAKQLENEAQEKASEVSEAVKEETITAKSPVSRKVYSAFAISESETTKEEPIQEGNSTGRKCFSWFNN